MITTCFTGHRPNKLGGYDWNSAKNQDIIKRLYTVIFQTIYANPQPDKTYKFICGGALGIDQMAFYLCSGIKEFTAKTGEFNIITEAAVPFEEQYIKWCYSDIQRYKEQLNIADIVTYVDTLEKYKVAGYREGVYCAAKMQKRNEYMVDNSSIVIAVWDGTSGGTANCVNYAKKLNKQLIVMQP